MCSSNKECEVKFEDSDICACDHKTTSQAVSCQSHQQIKIKKCYCVYVDQNVTIVGRCYYSCYKFADIIIPITTSVDFNANICGILRGHQGGLHRKGRFCGQCNETYGLAAYSYWLSTCVPCQDYGYRNWLQYFAVALLPLTAFYVLAIILGFNITSSSLNGVVLVTQCILSSVQVSLLQGNPKFIHYKTDLFLIKIITSLFCTVNLDFFRLVYPSFCLHPRANVFAILSLDYLVALYPFLLILLTYLLVTAHNKECWLMVWMWRPVKMCMHRLHITLKIKVSLIKIFATFVCQDFWGEPPDFILHTYLQCSWKQAEAILHTL